MIHYFFLSIALINKKCINLFSINFIMCKSSKGIKSIFFPGVTNYPIGVGINAAGEITIADNHNNFNLTVFSQDGQLISALESKV